MWWKFKLSFLASGPCAQQKLAESREDSIVMDRSVRCDAEGFFETVQCNMRGCYCADRMTGHRITPQPFDCPHYNSKPQNFECLIETFCRRLVVMNSQNFTSIDNIKNMCNTTGTWSCHCFRSCHNKSLGYQQDWCRLILIFVNRITCACLLIYRWLPRF